MPDADPSWYTDIVEQEAAAFGRLLSAGPLGAPVPTCPGWTMADLARHLGGIHRWATRAVRSGPSDAPPEGEVPAIDSPAELAEWFGAGATALAATLRECDPDQPCWTFAPPYTARFWMRRQAHETTMHRWDASVALGIDARIEEAVAFDGIEEVVAMFVPRQVRLGRLSAGPEVLELSCPADRRAVLATDPGLTGSAPTVSVAGPAEALLLLLWRRVGLDDPRLSLAGRVGDAQRLLGAALTP